MRFVQVIPILLIAVGIGLVIRAVLHGGAMAYLVVIFPVPTGTSDLFLLGVVLIIVGLFVMPFTLFASEPREGGAVPPLNPPSSVTTGGVILIGPVPILFGAWKNISSRQRWALAILGTALLVAVLVVILFA